MQTNYIPSQDNMQKRHRENIIISCIYTPFIRHDCVWEFFVRKNFCTMIAIRDIFILCCGEFSLLDPNGRCSRIFWNFL